MEASDFSGLRNKVWEIESCIDKLHFTRILTHTRKLPYLDKVSAAVQTVREEHSCVEDFIFNSPYMS